MKLPRSHPGNHGLTLMETVVVFFLLVVFVGALLLPELAAQKKKRSRISCTNNLKQIGLDFRIWAGDNNDKYPMAVSVTNGGAMEDALAGNSMRVFQVMSYELSTPRILVCPEDNKRQWATNFDSTLTAKNVSYFVNADIKNQFGRGFLCGDDNLELNGVPLRSGISFIASNSPIAWAAGRHPSSGNLLAADGSCQTITSANLINWLLLNGVTTMHLAVP